MRISVIAGPCLLAFAVAAGQNVPAGSSQRSAVFLFGPAGADGARQAARGAAAQARRWLGQPESGAELRRAGNADALALESGMAAKAIEALFLSAARDTRDTDPAVFLNSLDRAAQALVNQPGLRLLIAIVEEPPLSGDAENQLKQTIEFCRTNAIRVLVLDPADVPPARRAGPFQALAESTGGELMHNPKALETAMHMAGAASHAGENPYAPPAPETSVAAAGLPEMPSDLPVYTRFVKLSAHGARPGARARAAAVGRGGSAAASGPTTEQTTGPMRGLLFVEAPMSALKFEVDDNADVYTGRARVTQIARNTAGRIVWQASKTMTFRGSLKKLADRRGGNLYYMREVTLPAGQYNLEATVEDLVANKTGGVRSPLRTSMGTPGFAVSDAVLVRPFNGSADKFGADQVFGYDGDAISPLLAPVFRAEDPFTLQIYLVIYPDLYGAQPQLSLEILRNGKVVGRSALPFTDRIRNTATESSGMSSAIGEQKHEFPYMATLRNVQFSPGEYEARVTVRQGNVAVTRGTNFRVDGPERSAMVASAGPGAAAAAVPDEDAEITLPAVDPVHVAAGTALLPASEQQKLWDEASSSALSYASRLPNFRCRRATQRLTAPVRSADRFTESDSLVEELTYESLKETYRTVEVNGQKSSLARDALKGVNSRGEFGAMLKSVFRPEATARFTWAGRAMSGGSLCQVFEVNVPVDRSNFVLTFNLRQEIAGFHGRVFVDEETGLVRKIMLEGNGLPKDFGLQSPTFLLEYGMVKIAGQDHLLPLRSVLQVRQGKRVIRNETHFRDYRKFEASSEIRFQ